MNLKFIKASGSCFLMGNLRISMKKTTVLLLFCLLALSLMANPLSLVSSGEQGLELHFKTPALEISEQRIAQSQFHLLSLEGAELSVSPDEPALPAFATSFILPPSGGYEIFVQPISSEKIRGIRPIPAGRVYEEEDFEPDWNSYYDALGSSLAEAGEIAIMRDFRMASININPLSWDSKNNELTVHQEFRIQINFTNQRTDSDRAEYITYSPAFRSIYEAHFINFPSYRNLNTEQGYGKILLIHGSNMSTSYMTALNGYIMWKRQKGHIVNVASTQVAGTSNSAIKNYIQQQYNNPSTKPDFVILVGSSAQIPNFKESMSGYSGAGDYPYTHLEGNDKIGDVFIGRISAASDVHLTTILAKIYLMERDINLAPGSADWLNRVLLIGDPGTSGISCVYNSIYVREIAQMANPEYSFIENYSGGYSNTINTGFNQGVSFFSYRGWLGMSGWSPGNSLDNAPKYPHVVTLTCSTGNYDGSEGTTETLIRLGTAAQPRGAVTAIGMATTGTHTQYNNILNAGIFKGVFVHGMRTMGEALLSGKIYIREVYGNSHSNPADYSAHWCNLMGDPTMEVFVGIPKSLQINAPTVVVNGSKILSVNVTDSEGDVVPYASVTAMTTTSELPLAQGITDEFGNINLFFANGISSTLYVTAAKPNHKPMMKQVAAGAGGIVFSQREIFENGEHGSIGNGDSFATAGERVAMKLWVQNTTAETISGLQGEISCYHNGVQIIEDSVSFDEIAPNANVGSNIYNLFDLGWNLEPSQSLVFEVNLSDDQGSNWNFPIIVGAYNANIVVDNIFIDAGGDAVLDPGESASISLRLQNSSIAGATDLQAEIMSLNDMIQVASGSSFVGTIQAGSYGQNLQSFEVFANSALIPGMQMPIKLKITNDAGFYQESVFNLEIGVVSQHTPLGPDSYGYLIYDDTDAFYPDCPEYDWIEINPALGGPGSRIAGRDDDEYRDNDLYVVDLPFPFGFYGIEYDQITVCSNGFIAFGISNDPDYRNTPLPGGGGPSPMIAAFWDQLKINGDAGIYKYYDSTENTFIIEYYKLKNNYNNSLETFQLIFYDPLYYPTGMEDGMVKIQYQTFNNVETGSTNTVHGNYCTIGIKDHTGLRGLQYTYNNQYPQAAAPLGNNRAILITTVPILYDNPYLLYNGFVINDPNGNGIAEPSERIELGIVLSNQGVNSAFEANIEVSLNSPYATLINNVSDYPEIPCGVPTTGIESILIDIHANCPNNTVLNLNVIARCESGDWTFPVNIKVQKPMLSVETVQMNDDGGSGSTNPGDSFKLIVNLKNNADVEAKDISVSLNSGSPYAQVTNLTEVLSLIPAGGTVQAVFEISLSEDVPMGNNITFYFISMGAQVNAQTSNIRVSVGTTGMNADFEDNNGGFNATPVNGGWAWGSSSYAGAHSGNNVWGTVLNGAYSANANYILETPSVYVGESFMLEFWHRYETEANYDGGQVLINTGGSSWTLIYPEGAYPTSYINVLSGPGYSGSSGDWTLARFSLADYANQNAKFRFLFKSDSTTHNQGWFIDDVRTTGYLERSGKLHGNIFVDGEIPGYMDAMVISDSGVYCMPSSEGEYSLYLPFGDHGVSAHANGYYGFEDYEVSFSETDTIYELDMELFSLPAVQELQYTLSEHSVAINWTEPIDNYLDFVSYRVYRRHGASLFELVQESTELSYHETLIYEGDYWFYVVANYAQGQSKKSETISFNFDPTSSEDEGQSPLVTGLMGNFPNPFNPETTISFALANAAKVELVLYNIKGQKVRTLFAGEKAAGVHSLVFDGRDEKGQSVSSGIYLMRMTADGKSFSRKMTLLK